MMTKTNAACEEYAPSLEPVRALLLDDNTFDRARIRRLSRKTNFDVILDEVQSISEMDEAISGQDYDLVMLDYRLPVGDGLKALQHLQTAPRNRSAGRIMITGDGVLDTVVSAMRVGCHDFLCKNDMTVAELETAMQNALRATRANSDLAAQVDHRQAMKEVLRDALGQVDLHHVMAEFGQKVLHRQAIAASAELEGVMVAMLDDDEFIFH